MVRTVAWSLQGEGQPDLRRFAAKRGRLAALLVGTVALAAVMYTVFALFSVRRDEQGDGLLALRYPVRVEFAPQKAGLNVDRLTAAAVPLDTSQSDDLTGEDVGEEGPIPLSSPEGPPAAAAAINPSGLLPVDFDLSPDASGASGTSGQQIEIAKALMVNGRDAGKVALRVGRNSLLYLEREGLARALRQVDESLAERIADGEQPFVSFDELRDSGIAVRYDPIADGVRLES